VDRRYGGFRRPNSHISSGGLGTMGFGLPAAMGAAIGRPDKETWAIVGDGRPADDGSGVDDPRSGPHSCQGRVAQQPQAGHGPAVAGAGLRRQLPLQPLARPDWCKLAEAYGLAAFKADRPEQVDAAIAAARAVDGPALIEFCIAEQQNVFPMMPAGKGLSDLLEEQFEEPKL